VAGQRDDDEDFLALLDAYLDEPHDPNPRMANVQIVWIDIPTGRSSGERLVVIGGSSSCARTGPKARCVT
jgi:hypothetical protein